MARRLARATAIMAVVLVLGCAACPARSQVSTLVASFENRDKQRIGGDEIARLASEQVAAALARSDRYAVLKPDEIERTAQSLSIQSPYDPHALQKIAHALKADAIVQGQILSIKRGKSRCRLELRVDILDSETGDPINGAITVGQARADRSPGDVNSLTVEALHDAVERAVKQIVAFHLPEGIIMSSNGYEDVNSPTLLINRGTRDGIKQGMLLNVYRDRKRVGRVRVTDAYASDAEVQVVENINGVKPDDSVRAVFSLRNEK